MTAMMDLMNATARSVLLHIQHTTGPHAIGPVTSVATARRSVFLVIGCVTIILIAQTDLMNVTAGTEPLSHLFVQHFHVSLCATITRDAFLNLGFVTDLMIVMMRLMSATAPSVLLLHQQTIGLHAIRPVTSVVTTLQNVFQDIGFATIILIAQTDLMNVFAAHQDLQRQLTKVTTPVAKCM